MNKAVPWRLKGYDSSARDAGGEATRRQGMTLGEWLDEVAETDDSRPSRRREPEPDLRAFEDRMRERRAARRDDAEPRPSARSRYGEETPSRRETRTVRREETIADDAFNEFDERPHRRQDGARQDHPYQDRPRQDARRDDARRDDTHQREARDREADRPRRETTRDERETREESSIKRRSARNDHPRPERRERDRQRRSRDRYEIDWRVEDAIESLERRTAKSQRETADALEAVEQMLERGEIRRRDEQGRHADLFERLEDIEARITQSAKTDTLRPLRGTLKRLEAKLESLSRREPAPVEASRQEPARLWLRDPDLPRPHRTIGDAIADIGRRQRSLDEPVDLLGRAGAPAPIGGYDDAPPEQRDFYVDRRFADLQYEIGTLAGKLDDMHREMKPREPAAPRAFCDIDKLRGDIASMSSTLTDLAPQRAMSSVEQAIERLTERVEASRQDGMRESLVQPLEQVVRDLRHAVHEADPRDTIRTLEREIHAVGGKLEQLRGNGLDRAAFGRLERQVEEIRDLVGNAGQVGNQDAVERQVAMLAERIDRQMGGTARDQDDLRQAADQIRSLLGEQGRGDALRKIEQRLESLSIKVDDALDVTRGAAPYADLARRIETVHQQIDAKIAPAADTRVLEDLLRSLSDKIEVARQPQADRHAMQALEQQVARLAERLERTDGGFPTLVNLQSSIGDLFSQLDETRQVAIDAAETAARSAARETLRDAALGAPRGGDAEADREIAKLRAAQDDTDRRTHTALNAVHDTLAKIVDKLGAMERDIGDVRREPPRETRAAAPRAAASIAAQAPILPPASRLPDDAPPRLEVPRQSAMPADAADFLIEPGAGYPVGRGDKRPQRAPALDVNAEGEPAGRADFIAAARRAALAAQNEAAAALQQKQSPDPKGGNVAGLIAQARGYVASHKKSVALSVAALFLIVGTYAAMRTFGAPEGTAVSALPAPKTIARAAAQAPAERRPASEEARAPAVTPSNFQASALSPSSPVAVNAAQATIGGSDPIVTSSITPRPSTSLPSAVTAALNDPTRVTAVVREQALGGNPAAQFELATRLAEGRTVPRDLKQAADWFEKAATQGLAPAQYRIASLYEKGAGVTRDLGRARTWYRRAADQGNARAMHNLAVLTAEGGDGKPDYAGAAEWFRKAADYGIRDSQYNYAILLARGLGAPQNFVQSYTWFSLAAAQGDDDAAKKRDDVGSRLDARDLAKAKAEAQAFKPRTPDAAVMEVPTPAGGWDAAPSAKPVRPKISAL